MDLKEIEKLMASMVRAKMKRIAIKKEGFEIELERESSEENAALQTKHHLSLPAVYHHLPPPHHPEKPTLEPTTMAREEPKSDAKVHYITSPMVGTFYLAASPDEPSFVRVGDRVEEGTVVCIIEAMKVMNEVKAGMKGVVSEICVRNGDPVEFGTKMFRVEIK